MGAQEGPAHPSGGPVPPGLCQVSAPDAPPASTGPHLGASHAVSTLLLCVCRLPCSCPASSGCPLRSRELFARILGKGIKSCKERTSLFGGYSGSHALRLATTGSSQALPFLCALSLRVAMSWVPLYRGAPTICEAGTTSRPSGVCVFLVAVSEKGGSQGSPTSSWKRTPPPGKPPPRRIRLSLHVGTGSGMGVPSAQPWCWEATG